MRRTPLRPLPQILRARETGSDPDRIERANILRRHRQAERAERSRSILRLSILSACFLFAFMMVAGRMTMLASTRPAEPQAGDLTGAIVASRAPITDRHGQLLATNLVTNALYAQPPYILDKPRAIAALAAIFPDLDAERLTRDLTGERKFVWIRRHISPEEMQKVHDIGEPGLQFGPREMRLYPNGRLAAHVLGGTGFGREGVNAAELVGTAGIELFLDDQLRDPAQGDAPITLSLDVTVQAAVEKVLFGGMRLFDAKAASAVLMNARSGEILALASLPDFDPNDRPAANPDAGEYDPLFNRAVQGVYELGSVFKTLTAAQAMELGVAGPATMIAANAPMKWGRFTIREYDNKNLGPRLSLTETVVKSSNVATANLAIEIGQDRQRAFLQSLGLFDAAPVEIAEAAAGRPIIPRNWSELNTITAAYGHGIAVSPVHLAAAYSSVVNGGTLVRPTLLRRPYVGPGERIVRSDVSVSVRAMLAQVVERGTATLGAVPGYLVGGKTGTANKPKPGGGYHDEKVINTFAAIFPADDPAYVLVVTLDEPVETSGAKPRRTAGWTAVPVAAEIIARAAPLLDLPPTPMDAPDTPLWMSAN